jgi:MerR family transcriptional regulator, light-induced transcriptional regulator
MTAAERAAATLTAQKADVARAVVDLEFQRRPALWQRFGTIARQRCGEDAIFHLDFLCAALAFGQDAIFVQYVEWLVQLLRGYGIDKTHVADHFEVLREVLASTLAKDEALAASTTIDAGLQVLVLP